MVPPHGRQVQRRVAVAVRHASHSLQALARLCDAAVRQLAAHLRSTISAHGVLRRRETTLLGAIRLLGGLVEALASLAAWGGDHYAAHAAALPQRLAQRSPHGLRRVAEDAAAGIWQHQDPCTRSGPEHRKPFLIELRLVTSAIY